MASRRFIRKGLLIVRSYYSRHTPYQIEGVLTRPAVGLNEFTPPGSLNDNYMSDLIDVEGYREEAIKFFADTSVSKTFEESSYGLDAGRIIGAFESEDSDPDNGDYQFFGMAVKSAKWQLFHINYKSEGGSAYTIFDMTVPSVPAYADANDLVYSKTIFRTEANVFYVFAVNNYTRLHYIRHNYEEETNDYGYVDLPFYPTSMVSHANRIFCIDIRNRLWWSRAGDLFSWYSIEYDDDRLMASTAMGNKTYSLTGQIDTPRVFTATVETVGNPDTLGKLTIVGKNSLQQDLTATLPLYVGRVQTAEVFSSITSVVQSGWTAAGTADNIQFGVGPVGTGYVVDDAGYWTIENEPYVHELFSISNVLYISAGSSIYAFRGYSYETFSLQRLISNLGNPKNTTFGYKNVAVIRNKAYFINDDEIFEFNGDSPPKSISRPIIVNNALTNGMMGGIDFARLYPESDWALDSDSNNLYLYPKRSNPDFYYRFDFQTRTWWKMSGWNNTDFSSTNDIFVRLVPGYSADGFVPFFWEHADTGEDDFWFCSGTGSKGVTQNDVYPFVITKSFQSSPSETGTLTSIILAIKGTDESTANIKVMYDLTENGTVFEDVWSDIKFMFNGDMQILSIPVHVAKVANAHHYRLKIIISSMGSNPVYLYNIERRFRVRGYSR